MTGPSHEWHDVDMSRADQSAGTVTIIQSCQCGALRRLTKGHASGKFDVQELRSGRADLRNALESLIESLKRYPEGTVDPVHEVRLILRQHFSCRG